jgi:hypothetical protein
MWRGLFEEDIAVCKFVYFLHIVQIFVIYPPPPEFLAR